VANLDQFGKIFVGEIFLEHIEVPGGGGISLQNRAGQGGKGVAPGGHGVDPADHRTVNRPTGKNIVREN
jgi:hypothetical protein